MWIIITGLVVSFIVLLIFHDMFGGEVTGFMAILSLIALLVFLVGLPINRICVRRDIIKYRAYKSVISESRDTNTGEFGAVERATIVNQMAELTADIGKHQYWNKTIFDWYIPDDVHTIRLNN
jgi:hypothetical protein